MNDDKLPAEQDKDAVKSSNEKLRIARPENNEPKQSGSDATAQQNHTGKEIDNADDSNKAPLQDQSKESIEAGSKDLTKDEKVENLDIKLDGNIKITEQEAKLAIQIDGSKSNRSEVDDAIQSDKMATEQKIKNKKVKTQTIVQKAEVLNLYMEAQEKIKGEKPEEVKFEDPTLSLPHKPSNLPEFKANEEVTFNLHKLITERILLISCFDEDILLASAYALVERPEMVQYEKRMLVFEGINQDRTDLNLETLIRNKIEKRQKQIIIINVTSKLFLDSLFAGQLFAEDIKTRLKKYDTFLLCLVESKLFKETLKKRSEGLKFCHWEIAFLAHLLLQKYSSEQAKSLEAWILELRGFGLWGEYNSDKDFYDYVSSYLREDNEQFFDRVKNWYTESKELDRNTFLNKVKAIKPSQVFDYKNKIISTVLYVATFFPELTLPQFNKLVLTLLQGLKARRERKQVEEMNEGKRRIIRSIEEKELVDLWKEKTDTIFNKCYLRARGGNNSIIEFNLPYLRTELISYLKQNYPNFLYQQFEKINASGLFFQPQASPGIIRGIIDLTVSMVLSDSENYGCDWLLRTVSNIKSQIRVDLAIQTGGPIEELANLLARVEEDRLRRQFYSRLSDLIREMLNHSELDGIVRTFFEKLIESHHHDAALEIVLEISKRLKDTPQFDTSYWMKRLIDQGQENIKLKTYFALLENTKQAGFRIFEALTPTMNWLPETEREIGRYSPSNFYALQLLLDYCTQSVLSYKSENFGIWPPVYPLFGSLITDENLASERVSLFVKWLFHPGMKHLLHRNFDDEDVLLHAILADLIEAWMLILKGYDDASTQKDGEFISNLLIQQIVENTDRKRQRLLLQRWRFKRNDYLSMMAKFSNQEKDKKRIIAQRRKLIFHLEESLSKQLQEA